MNRADRDELRTYCSHDLDKQWFYRRQIDLANAVLDALDAADKRIAELEEQLEGARQITDEILNELRATDDLASRP